MQMHSATTQKNETNQLFGDIATLKFRTAPLQVIMFFYRRYKSIDAKWYSEPFYTHIGGYKMCLQVYPNGHWIGTHVSVYINLMRGENDDKLKWPFRGDIMIQLLDNYNDVLTEHTVSFDDRVYGGIDGRVLGQERAPNALGTPRFVACSALSHLNSLKFWISVKV